MIGDNVFRYHVIMPIIVAFNFDLISSSSSDAVEGRPSSDAFAGVSSSLTHSWFNFRSVLHSGHCTSPFSAKEGKSPCCEIGSVIASEACANMFCWLSILPNTGVNFVIWRRDKPHSIQALTRMHAERRLDKSTTLNANPVSHFMTEDCSNRGAFNSSTFTDCVARMRISWFLDWGPQVIDSTGSHQPTFGVLQQMPFHRSFPFEFLIIKYTFDSLVSSARSGCLRCFSWPS